VTRVGRVPLFFYLWQWPLAHGLALGGQRRGRQDDRFVLPQSPPAVFARARPGFDLPVVYLCWQQCWPS
jgi:hypothetical protein